MDLKVFFEDDRISQLAFNIHDAQKKITKWRMRERMKTVSVALVYCLNIGVDPPDVIKTEPCARLEAWLEPSVSSAQKSLETIGKQLQSQYERWQPRARYKQCLDPTTDEVRKLCQSLRRNAKDERVLFHYNGHGVPRPTSNGEIWVFNKNYTQYIPLSIYELQTWLGNPSIYVFDCSNSGLIVEWFQTFAKQRESEGERLSSGAASMVPSKDYILLAPCGRSEQLPMNPNFPADIFTSCLTTPIKMALEWFRLNSFLLKDKITSKMIDRIPGRLPDRKTPLGELNWIFTAITDTIAWNILPRDLFQKLFRQDLLVASLFRNFLLAERIMRSLGCHPISHPKLPATHQHHLWQAWDLAVDQCMTSLIDIIEDPSRIGEYKHSTFFAEQLTAFEVWLNFGSERKEEPEQLPIVLQVLLSQTHRLRALVLLGRFLDLGPWAVNLALSVGIFPYVLKLLQSTASDLREILVFIWTKILALDKSCQLDLVKDNGHNYFIHVLSSNSVTPDQRAMSAFILSVIANNCRPGQSACLSGNLLAICLNQMNDPDPLVRKWVILCMAKLWESFEEAKACALSEGIQDRLSGLLLSDPIPEVRAAAVYALGTFIGGGEMDEKRATIDLNIGLALIMVTQDANPLVRKEYIILLGRLIRCYGEPFLKVATDIMQEKEKARELFLKDYKRSKKSKKSMGDSFSKVTPDMHITNFSTQSSIYGCLWNRIVSFQSDPCKELAKMATSIVKNITNQVSTPQQQQQQPPPKFGESPSNSRSSSSKSLRGTWSLKKLNSTSSLQYSSSSSSSSPLRRSDSFQSDTEETTSSTEEIQSLFYEMSCEYFSKPLFKKETGDYMGWPYEQWVKRRNTSIIHTSQKLKDETFKKNIKFDAEIAVLENTPDCGILTSMHSFEPIVAVADDKEVISIWDRERCTKLNIFKNYSYEKAIPNLISSTTSLSFINEHQSPFLLLTGSNNGCVRIWKDYDQPGQQKLLSAWKALEGPTGKGLALTINFQQEFSRLLTSGNVEIIRVWDIEKELLVQDVHTNAETGVTSLTSNRSSMHTFAASLADGKIHIFDQRRAPKYSLISTLQEETDLITKISMPIAKENMLISGSITGQIKVWDLRNSSRSVNSFQAHRSSASTVPIAVHSYAPLIASASQKQVIKIFNFEGEVISLIRYYDGFLGQRNGSVTTLSFHPYLPFLAAATTDSAVTIYSTPK